MRKVKLMEGEWVKVVSKKTLREMKTKRMTKLTKNKDDGTKRDNGVTVGKTKLTKDNDDGTKRDNDVTVGKAKLTKDNDDRTKRDSEVTVGKTKLTKDNRSDGDGVSRRMHAESRKVSDNGYLLGEDGCELIRRIGLTDDALRRKKVQSVVGR